MSASTTRPVQHSAPLLLSIFARPHQNGLIRSWRADSLGLCLARDPGITPCCKTRLLLAIGFGGEFWCPCPALPSTALTHRYRNLTPRLREANGGHRWRRTAEKLSKPPQVLCSCCE